jgi:hypothetical protein
MDDAGSLIISAVSLCLNFYVLRSKWMPLSRGRLKEAENKYQKLRRAVGPVVLWAVLSCAIPGESRARSSQDERLRFPPQPELVDRPRLRSGAGRAAASCATHGPTSSAFSRQDLMRLVAYCVRES